MAIFHNRWVRFFGPLAVLAVAAFLLRDKMPFLAEGYDDVRDANNTGLILGFIAVFASIVAMAEVKTVMPAARVHGESKPVGDYHGDVSRHAGAPEMSP